MLAVITFMAITFLAIARREKGQVATTTDQTTARFASDAGTEDAKARLVASIMATTNVYSFDLLTSTNFINRAGFQSGVANPTNVNYAYPDGTALKFGSANNYDGEQNLGNLLYSPRVPVFITNRLAPPFGSKDQ